jgi:hypothetical protein
MVVGVDGEMRNGKLRGHGAYLAYLVCLVSGGPGGSVHVHELTLLPPCVPDSYIPNCLPETLLLATQVAG